MTVGRVKDFSFPNSGQTQVRGHFRNAPQKAMCAGGGVETDKMAMGGIVSPPKSGIRSPRPASGVKAQKYVEGMAARPGRGPRVGAKLTVAKPVSGPSMGALQSATAPMIPATGASAMAKGGRLSKKD